MASEPDVPAAFISPFPLKRPLPLNRVVSDGVDKKEYGMGVLVDDVLSSLNMLMTDCCNWVSTAKDNS